MNLNGKTRYRTTWRGRLVLQVQLANMDGTWRDATVNDMACSEVRGDLIGKRPTCLPPRNP